MNVHKNARLTVYSRAELVRRVLGEGQPPKAVAAAFGVDVKTVRKWGDRFQWEGPAGLVDRSSRPKGLRQPTPVAVALRIIALRRQRWTGQQIAKEAKVSPATVSRILRQVRLSRIRDLEPPQPVVRYERQTPETCSIPTSRSSAASTRSVTASPVIEPARAATAASEGARPGRRLGVRVAAAVG